MEFTIDQSAIINSTKNLIIQNYGDSGFIETIYGAIRNKKKCKTLLLAASESSKQKFIERLDLDQIKNVRVETAFSLAWKKIGHKQIVVKKNGYTPFEIKNILHISSSDVVYDLRLAYFVSRMCICQCRATSEQDVKARFLKTLFQEEDITFFWQNESKLIAYTAAFINLMHRREIPCIPEYCLKLYYQSNPIIRCNFIVVEDAPNTSEAILKVIKSQKALKFIFGDDHQKKILCNNWRRIFEDSMYFTKSLDKSFDHSANVATYINEIIGWKKYLYENFDYPLLHGSYKKNNINTHAYIGKNRVTVLNKAFEIYCNETKSKPAFFEQGLNFYLHNDDGTSLKDILHLYTEEHSRIKHPFIQSIESIELLEQYAIAVKDENCQGLIELVKKHRKGLHEMMRVLSRSESKGKKARKLTINFSTAKLINRYGEITMLDDFVNQNDIIAATHSNQTPDFFHLENEINMLYQSASRAIHKLDFETDSSESEVKPARKDDSAVKSRQIDQISKETNNELAYSLNRSKKHHKNIFNKWTTEQDQYLVNMHQKEKSIADIAHKLKRTKSAVTSRLRKLRESD
ncbi:MAG: hypothetical protein AAFQ94_06595 [Bacteroidota bacterium]